MTDPADPLLRASRRGFLTGAAGLVGAAGVLATTAAGAKPTQSPDHLPFYGDHQPGIITPQQRNVSFAAFDLITDKREEVIALLKAWTEATASLTVGQIKRETPEAADQAPIDSGEALGLSPQRLTVTFGFGPGLFSKEGHDRYGLMARRPAALIDLPRFNGDQLIAERTGGDLAVQACADDAQVAFHAIRLLARLADGVAQFRWVQNGFIAPTAPGETPRNLMGFKDGTMNPSVTDPSLMADLVWVGDEGGWMRRGSYMVARPIRIALEHWDRMKLSFQEQTMGRHKVSGAPLGKSGEFDALDLDAVGSDGDPLIPENAHVRLGAPAVNQGAQILRRAYSYDNGLNFIAERWPPWRQGLQIDAGLLFICYQRDPRTGFVKIFENMAKFDMLNQFATHIGGGLFACPPGVKPGGFIGQELFAA